ncbi:MAG TPA: hypothetical protein VE869_17910 [Gemmatimonas sp.]|nr:hypothetical protein [Gemmatimonas sp.]
MSKSGLPAAVQHLIWHKLRTVDHVAVLLAVRTAGVGSANTASAQAMVSPPLAAEILEELTQRGLLERHGTEYRFNPDEALDGAVAQLAEMYNTKPVTLVRAIYDRPVHVIKQFADAFRLRRDEDLK